MKDSGIMAEQDAPIIRSSDESKLSAEAEEALLAEAIELQFTVARDQWLHVKRATRQFAVTLVNIKRNMEMLTQRTVSDKEIAERLDLELSGQMVGQYRLTVEHFDSGELIKDGIAFETYRVARQEDKGKHSARELARIVAEHPTVKEIKEFFAPAPEERTTHIFTASSTRNVQTKKRNSSARYDGKSEPQYDAPKLWADLATKAAATALAHAIVHMTKVSISETVEQRAMMLRRALHDMADYVMEALGTEFSRSDSEAMLGAALRWSEADERYERERDMRRTSSEMAEAGPAVIG